MDDVDAAGGITAILNEISKVPGLLNLDYITVSGVSLGQRIKGAAIKNPDCIHTLENAYSKGRSGGFKGNLAPKGCVVKAAGVVPQMLKHTRTLRDLQ
jgi:dihydroxy-acid dehydratase